MSMDFMTAMEITASGLGAERVRMNVVASNLANARTTRTAAGGPYQRMDAVFRAVPVAERMSLHRADPTAQYAYLVEVPEIRQDATPGERVYDPGHPDADDEGYITLPNVSVVAEMVNMITASRAYEAGVSVMDSLRTMARSAISIGG